MSPIVLQALEALTFRVNLSTGLSNYSDESAAKEIFKLLYKEGEHLLAIEITPWAMWNGWKPKDAKQLGNLAERIGSGGRVIVHDKNQWSVDIITTLKANAYNLKI